MLSSPNSSRIPVHCCDNEVRTFCHSVAHLSTQWYKPHPFLDGRTLPVLATAHLDTLTSALEVQVVRLSSGGAGASDAAANTIAASLVTTLTSIALRIPALKVRSTVAVFAPKEHSVRILTRSLVGQIPRRSLSVLAISITLCFCGIL